MKTIRKLLAGLLAAALLLTALLPSLPNGLIGRAQALGRNAAWLLREGLLWTAYVLFFPPDRAVGCYANDLAKYNIVAKESLFVLANMLGYAPYCDTRYKQDWERLPKHGDQVTLKKPPRYTLRRGNAMAVQGINQPTVTATVRPKVGVDLELSHAEMNLITGQRFSEFRKEVAEPAMSQVAAGIDADIATEARLNFYNYVGTAGTAPTTLADLLAPNTRLNEEGAPTARRVGVLGPNSHGSLVNGLSGNFVRRVIDEAELRANLDFPIAGLERVVMSQSTPAHTVGVFGGAPVVDGAGQNGTTLNLRGFTAGSILNRGDVIQIANVNAINYQTRQSTGVLRQFVITADATANAAGEMACSIYPALNPPIGGVDQQFQTVDSFAADGAAVTVVTGTTGAVNQENVVFHKNALGIISIPQVIPPDAYFATMLEYNGIAMRFWMDSDITNDRALMRCDWFGIIAAFYPEVGTRMAG